MKKQFAIYKKERVSRMQNGNDGYMLIQIVPEYFDTIKEAEKFISKPENKLNQTLLTHK